MANFWRLTGGNRLFPRRLDAVPDDRRHPIRAGFAADGRRGADSLWKRSRPDARRTGLPRDLFQYSLAADFRLGDCAGAYRRRLDFGGYGGRDTLRAAALQAGSGGAVSVQLYVEIGKRLAVGG